MNRTILYVFLACLVAAATASNSKSIADRIAEGKMVKLNKPFSPVFDPADTGKACNCETAVCPTGCCTEKCDGCGLLCAGGCCNKPESDGWICCPDGHYCALPGYCIDGQ